MKKVTYANDSLAYIDNTSKNWKICLLFFSTRVDFKSVAKWHKLLELIETDNQIQLFIFDKTPNCEISNFIRHSNKECLNRVTIINRSRNEYALDTISNLKFCGEFWIGQLHDDDFWQGYINSTFICDLNSIYEPIFEITNASTDSKIDSMVVPALIQFCLIPSWVYIRFCEFLNEQHLPISASADQVLNKYSRLLCKFQTNSSFKYKYNMDHWKTRKSAKKELYKLTNQEGWKAWSGVDIAMINRTIDEIISLFYLDDLISSKILASELKFSLNRLKPHKLRILFNYFLLAFKGPLYKFICFLNSENKDHNCYLKLNLLKFKRDVWNCSSLGQLLSVLRKYKLEESFPKLRHRFLFWERKLSDSLLIHDF